MMNDMWNPKYIFLTEITQKSYLWKRTLEWFLISTLFLVSLDIIDLRPSVILANIYKHVFVNSRQLNKVLEMSKHRPHRVGNKRDSLHKAIVK